jgi:HPt (histidine-containing phosphotransfer) domain-containing protein
MDGYLTKPLNPKELVRTIDAVLAGATVRPVETDAPSPPPADFAALLQSCSGEIAFVAELLGHFRTQAAKDLAEMRQAVDQGNADGLRRSAHSLKGAAAYFSAGPIRDWAQRLEDAGRNRNLDGAGEAVARMQRDVDACITFIETRIEAAPAAMPKETP